MALRLVAAQSARRLLPLLVDRLSSPQADVFAPDIVVVPTVGHRDWLAEELGSQLGSQGAGPICANVTFWLPNEFNQLIGGAQGSTDEHWNSQRLRWHLLRILAVEPSRVPGLTEASPRFAPADRLAALFDRYAVHRPDMLVAWATGAALDPVNPLPEDHRWQFELWREIRAQLGESPAEFAVAARTAESLEALPGRLTLFGLEVFSAAKVELLRAVSRGTDVLALTVFPAPRTLSDIPALAPSQHLRRSRSDLLVGFQHPLTRAWGRPAVEAATLLRTAVDHIAVEESSEGASDLQRLQRSIAEDRALLLSPSDLPLLGCGDGSIQVHRCHGVTRQIQVLRDALLHRLADDPTLHPRDILVICPDLAAFAPVLEPILSAEIGGVSLPVAIVDKSAVSATPVAIAVDSLLMAAGGRLELSTVLGLMALEPIRRRFGLTEEQASATAGWLTELGVTWGLDDAHRSQEPWSYPSNFPDGTWRQAIDRLVAGILLQSTSDREAPGGVIAFDDLSGASIDGIAALSAFLGALDRLVTEVSDPRPLDHWHQILSDVVVDFLDVKPDDRNQIEDLKRLIRQLADHADVAGDARLDLSEIRSFLDSGLGGVRARSRQWVDCIRIGSLGRFRGVPARVIAILGFDDGAFRSGRADGDDILALDPRIGERDIAAEERLGLLSTIASAGDGLVITCTGHDITNNSSVPMTVALRELVDTVAAVISATSEADRGHRPVVIDHSRQLADPVNLGVADGSGTKNVVGLVDTPWTFDPSARRIAEQIAGGTADSSIVWPTLDDVDPTGGSTELSLRDLHDAVRRPTDVYLRDRLQISLPAENRPTSDDIALWPDILDLHDLGSELIAGRRAGVDPDEWKRLRTLAGGLPPGALRTAVWSTLDGEVDRLLSVDGVTYTPTGFIDVDLPVGPIRLVDAIEVCGDQIVSVSYSKWHPRHRVGPWLQLAAATLAQPGRVQEAVVIGLRHKSTVPADHERFVLTGDTVEERTDSARRILEFAVDLRRRAMNDPIPLFERTSWDHLIRSRSDVGTAWSTDARRASVAMIFGHLTLADLRALPPVPELDAGLPPSVSRLDQFAEHLQDTWRRTVTVTDAVTSRPIPRSKKVAP